MDSIVDASSDVKQRQGDKMMESKPIVSSFIWKFLERGAAQVFALIVQIVLARLLAPEDFGVLAVLLVFINLSNVLIQKGFATALVQKEHIEDILCFGLVN